MLALIGSGEYLSGMDPVDRSLLERLGQPIRVICLPTAAGMEGDERVLYWMQLGIDHFSQLGVEVEALPVIDAASAGSEQYAKSIAAANFIYLSGGNPSYLYRTLAGSAVWKAILSVLDRDGLLAGCSAGAMIMGEKIFGFPGWTPGFNFLPGTVVVPHYDEIPHSLVSSVHLLAGKHYRIIGVEGNTCLLFSEHQFEVIGSGCVTFWDQDEKEEFAQGPVPERMVHS